MKNYLEHKGYIATIQFSADDRAFFGKIEAINDLITFEADNVKDLESRFVTAVEDYLDTCKELGKEPDKTFIGVFNVRVNSTIHKKLFLMGRKRGLNLNQLVARSVSFTIDNEDLVLQIARGEH